MLKVQARRCDRATWRGLLQVCEGEQTMGAGWRGEGSRNAVRENGAASRTCEWARLGAGGATAHLPVARSYLALLVCRLQRVVSLHPRDMGLIQST